MFNVAIPTSLVRRSVCFAVLVALLFVSGCAGTTFDSSPERGVYQDIMERQHEGVPVDGDLLNLRDVPEPGANDFEALGDSYLEKGRLVLAYSKYEKAVALAPSRPDLRYKSGLVLLRKGLAEEALARFDEILYLESGYAYAYQGRGRALYTLGRLEAAEVALLRSIELDPEVSHAHEVLGVLYDRQRRHAEAVQAYRRALELNPGDVSVLNNLGMAHYLLGEYSLSAAALERALLVGGAEARTSNNLARTYVKLGRSKDALRAFRQAGSSATAFNNLGVLLLEEGRTRTAAACFQRAIEENPAYYAKAADNLRLARERLGEDAYDQLGTVGSRWGSCP